MLNPDIPSEPENKEAPPESLKDPQKTEEPKAECSTPEPGTSEKAVVAETGPVEVEDCSRERLKRHRTEMAGQVWIPETWGQENLLKDWVERSALDTSLVPEGLLSAREALVHESRRANSSELTVENRLLCPWVGFDQGMGVLCGQTRLEFPQAKDKNAAEWESIAPRDSSPDTKQCLEPRDGDIPLGRKQDK